MPLDTDWRLQGQEAYLQDTILHWRQWRQIHENWDHDHCEFCGAKFGSGGLSEGYAPRRRRMGWLANQRFRVELSTLS
jgi:hypothetical protein